MQLLVTRPQPDAERTAAALRARGHAVVVAPLLSIESIDFELPDALPGAVVLTSANAARSIARHPGRALLLSLPAFAVGAHTAQEARAAGFRDVHSADGDRFDLMRVLGDRFGSGSRPLLHLAGEHRSGELTGCSAPVVTVVAYRARAADHFPAALERELSENRIDGVLHLSRRTVEAYLDCAIGAGLLGYALQPRHFCLSRQVAGPLVAAGAAAIRFPARPQEPALIDLIGT